VTAREVINRLRREGWAERLGEGSHAIFSKPNSVSIPVPRHGLDLPTGTLRTICRDAGWEWPPER
jgi:predicted RNA binding protein YcfA (HicA-like mRNA interferase family)